MKIWLALLIPVAFAIILYSFKELRKKTAWWEVPLMIVICLGLIGLMKVITEKTETADTERFMDYVVYVEHQEYWNEWIVETCSEEYACGTDSDGNTQYCTRYYDCSYQEEYRPYTKVVTKLGKTYTYYEGYNIGGFGSKIGSSPQKYNQLVKKFKTNPRFIKDRRRSLDKDYGPRYRGAIYRCYWNGKIEDIEHVQWNNTYENRIQASNTIDRHIPLDSNEIKEYEVFEYPEIYNSYNSRSILGYNDYSLDNYSNQRNSYIATKKQLKTYFLVFKNKSRNAVEMQKRHWGGGNKNEAIICIGIDDHNNIQWAGVFSWSKNETFKIEIRDYIEKHKRLDKNTFLYIIDYSYKNLENNFVRREFAEFSYLTVEPPGWALWTTFILVFVFCVGLTIWNLTNEHDIDGINYR